MWEGLCLVIEVLLPLRNQEVIPTLEIEGMNVVHLFSVDFNEVENSRSSC